MTGVQTCALPIFERILDLEAGEIQDMVLATCDYDLEQLERFATEIVGRFRRPHRAGLTGEQS